MDKTLKESLLMDFYGELLPQRQKDVMKLYYEEDLSLSEISEEFEISRQGVHDALKKAQHSLAEYEKKLLLIQRFQYQREIIKGIYQEIEDIIINNKDKLNLQEDLNRIKKLIEDLE